MRKVFLSAVLCLASSGAAEARNYVFPALHGGRTSSEQPACSSCGSASAAVYPTATASPVQTAANPAPVVTAPGCIGGSCSGSQTQGFTPLRTLLGKIVR